MAEIPQLPFDELFADTIAMVESLWDIRRCDKELGTQPCYSSQ
jgi:hypothetical protein